MELNFEYATTIKKMSILLMLAFLGSQFSAFGHFMWIWMVQPMLNSYLRGGVIRLTPDYDPIRGIITAAGLFLLVLVGLLLLCLYIKRGRLQVGVALLGASIWLGGHVIKDAYWPNGSYELFLIIVNASVVSFCLLLSRKTGWADLTGLGLGLLIGVGVFFFSKNVSQNALFSLAPIWLSAVFLPELISKRASIGALSVGVLLGLVFIMLDGTLVFGIMSTLFRTS